MKKRIVEKREGEALVLGTVENFAFVPKLVEPTVPWVMPKSVEDLEESKLVHLWIATSSLMTKMVTITMK